MEKLRQLLQDLKSNDQHLLLFISEHGDDEYEDLDVFLQEPIVHDLLRELTTDSELYKSDEATKYFEMHQMTPVNYLHPELLLLCYYIADDEGDLSEELKTSTERTLDLLRNVLEYPENEFALDTQSHETTSPNDNQQSVDSLESRVTLFRESLVKTVPLCCEHIVRTSNEFEESSLYQQLLNQMLGPNVDNVLGTMESESSDTDHFDENNDGVKVNKMNDFLNQFMKQMMSGYGSDQGSDQGLRVESGLEQSDHEQPELGFGTNNDFMKQMMANFGLGSMPDFPGPCASKVMGNDFMAQMLSGFGLSLGPTLEPELDSDEQTDVVNNEPLD